MSVLTDQVEAQGEKIRDLESSLEEHRQKLASTEEMLQQVMHTRKHTHLVHTCKAVNCFDLDKKLQYVKGPVSSNV